MNDDSPLPSNVEIDKHLTAIILERLRRVDEGKYVAYEVHETLAHVDKALDKKRRREASD